MNYAIDIGGGSSITVTGNTILNARRGVWISPAGTGYLVSSNRFNLVDTGIGINSGTGVTITGNTFTINGGQFDGTVGGGSTTVTNPIRITNNTINATATGPGLCWGMNINDWGASSAIYAVITGNRVNFTSSGGSVTGIGMNGAIGVDLGGPLSRIVVSGNTINVDVTSSGIGSEGRGIALIGPEELWADTTGLSNNTIDVDSSGRGLVAGVYTQMDDDTYVNINNNVMTGLTGAGDVYGIRSFTTIGHPDAGIYGVSGNPNTITGNRIGLNAGSDGTGIYVGAEGNIFATVTGNPQINVIGTGEAVGGRFYANGTIGNTGSVPSYFQNNSGTINGGANRYLLNLWTGVNGTVNFFNWSGNSFTPVGGGGTWSGG